MKKISKLNINVGKKLKNARIAAGFTQEEVAEKFDCSNRYIGQLETNRTLGSIDFIIELCNIYGTTLNTIYSDYLKFDFDKSEEISPSIVGYYKLDDEYRSIIDNNIQYLSKLQKVIIPRLSRGLFILRLKGSFTSRASRLIAVPTHASLMTR